ncbi:hypothetical protein CMI37_05165 [Candidatus Pacearchaeota archaeon]|nr:hypothetical protein [Candidatus Pacearchaeota archaeon]|tara:strand:+ start:137 stop:409 length:273 start_codon:yes stop_codon:yes gene_type:complete
MDESKKAVEEGTGVKMPLDQEDLVTKPTVLVMLRNINKNLLRLIDLMQTLIISGPLKTEYESFKRAAEAKDLDAQRDKERTDREDKKGDS